MMRRNPGSDESESHIADSVVSEDEFETVDCTTSNSAAEKTRTPLFEVPVFVGQPKTNYIAQSDSLSGMEAGNSSVQPWMPEIILSSSQKEENVAPSSRRDNCVSSQMRINKKNTEQKKLIAEASIDVITMPKSQTSTGKGIVIYRGKNETESPMPQAKGPSVTVNQPRILPTRRMKGAQAIKLSGTHGQVEKRNCVTNQLFGNTEKRSVVEEKLMWLQDGLQISTPTCGVGGNENSQEEHEPEIGGLQSRSKISNNKEFLEKLHVVIEEVVASSSEPIKKRARVHYPKNVNEKKLKVLHPKNPQLSATKSEIDHSSITWKSQQICKPPAIKRPISTVGPNIPVTKLPAPPSSSLPIPAEPVESPKKMEEKKAANKRKNSPEGGLQSEKKVKTIQSEKKVKTIQSEKKVKTMQSEKKVKTMLSQKKNESVSSLESVVPDRNAGVQQTRKSTRGRPNRETNTETPSNPVIKDTLSPSLKFVGEAENTDEINDL